MLAAEFNFVRSGDPAERGNKALSCHWSQRPFEMVEPFIEPAQLFIMPGGTECRHVQCITYKFVPLLGYLCTREYRKIHSFEGFSTPLYCFRKEKDGKMGVMVFRKQSSRTGNSLFKKRLLHKKMFLMHLPKLLSHLPNLLSLQTKRRKAAVCFNHC